MNEELKELQDIMQHQMLERENRDHWCVGKCRLMMFSDVRDSVCRTWCRAIEGQIDKFFLRFLVKMDAHFTHIKVQCLDLPSYVVCYQFA